MFSSISWQEFLNTALIALALYYVVSILILYSKDMVARFKNPPQPEPVDSERRNYPLMGQIRKDTPKKHEHFVEAQDLVVDPANGSRAERSEETLLINSVSHLLREVKVLARVVKENNGSKADATPMFQSLLSNYAHLAATKYRESIMVFIHDTIRGECAFEVALHEIESWWPEEKLKDNK
jgi:hypothetical protein